MSGRSGSLNLSWISLNILCHLQPPGGAWVLVLRKTNTCDWALGFPRIWIHATDTIGFDWAGFFPLWTSTEIMRIVKCLVEIPVNRPLQYSVRFVLFFCFFLMEPTVVSWQYYKWTTGASLILSTALPHYYQDGCHCGSNSFMLLVCPCPTCTVSISSVFCSFHQ